MGQVWSDEFVDAATAAARKAWWADDISTPAQRWRAAVLAALTEAYEKGNYLDLHPDVRDFLVEDAEEVRWAGVDAVEVGEGVSACRARRGENPNWVLQHAANALMLYRVLMGHEPWPTDRKAAERTRMAQALNLTDASFRSADSLAAKLQELGFTLPERPAA